MEAYSGSALLLQSTPDDPSQDTHTCGWDASISEITAETIPGRHEEFLRSQDMMDAVSTAMARRLSDPGQS